MRPATAAAVAALALFVAINAAFVVGAGVCCADDGFTATIAKNLAWGFGYSTSLGYATPYFSVERFDAHATTGPTLVLPVSVAIRILGNRAWVPGAVQVTLWTLLPVSIWRALGPMATPPRAAVAGAAFLLVSYAVSPYHLEHWYAMLGEVPAALAILLAFTVWAVDPLSSRRLFVAAVALSMAVLTKILALVYAATFLVTAAAVGLRGVRDRKTLGRLLISFVVGLVLPLATFEAWRAVSLGPGGYMGQVRALGRLMRAQGISGAFSAAEITTRLIAFDTRFGVSLPGLLVLAVFGGAVAWRTGSPAFKRLFAALLTGVAVHAFYWLVLSIGWPRYFFIGLVLLAALVTIPYLALEGRAAIVLYSVALAVSLIGVAGRVALPLQAPGGRWFAPSSIRSSQKKVVRFLDARADRRPFIGQWWAPVADLEYLSEGVLNFKGYRALTPQDLSRGVLVVTNSRFDDASDEAFQSLLAGCGRPVHAAPPYAIYECGGQDGGTQHAGNSR